MQKVESVLFLAKGEQVVALLVEFGQVNEECFVGRLLDFVVDAWPVNFCQLSTISVITWVM